jgi:hypothetical protein
MLDCKPGPSVELNLVAADLADQTPCEPNVECCQRKERDNESGQIRYPAERRSRRRRPPR